jgi:hypothetical protein
MGSLPVIFKEYILSHYAKVVDGKVVSVIVAEAEFFDTFVDSSPGAWVKTSYNTRGNVHYVPDSNTPSADQSKALRGNYAGLGYTYDPVADVFYAPQPYASWVLSPLTFLWEAPVAMPADGKNYEWDEATTSWKELVAA